MTCTPPPPEEESICPHCHGTGGVTHPLDTKQLHCASVTLACTCPAGEAWNKRHTEHFKRLEGEEWIKAPNIGGWNNG